MYQWYSDAIQGEEWCPLLHLGVVAIEKGAFWLPSTTVANFTFTFHSYTPIEFFTSVLADGLSLEFE